MGFFEVFTPDIQKLHDTRDVRGLAKALSHADPQIARKAAFALQDLPASAAVIPLIQALSSPDKDIRRMSAAALGATRDPRAIPGIVKAVSDEDLGVRLEAVKVLARLRDESSTALFTRLVNDPNLDIRMEAITGLGKTHDPAAIPPLLRTLVDPQYGIRELSAQSLDALGWVPAHNQDKVMYYIAKREWRQLAGLREDAIKPLLWALKDPYYVVRQGAASTLGKLKDIRAVRALVVALTDDESIVRMEVASALGEISDKRTIPALVKALDDEYIGVRISAAYALDRMSWKPATETEQILYLIVKERWLDLAKIGKKAAGKLTDRLNDSYYHTRNGVAGTLRKLGSLALEPMLEALNRPDPDVRCRALWILGNVGNSRAVIPITLLLQDDDPTCRKEAVAALGEIGDPRAILFLKQVIDRQPESTPDVIRAIGKIPGPASIPVLASHIRNSSTDIRLLVIRALGQNRDRRIPGIVAPLMNDSDPEIRAAVATVLSKFPQAEVATLLLLLLPDPHPDVRLAVLKGMQAWENAKVVPELVARLGDVDPRVRRLAAQTLDRWKWVPVSVNDRRNYLVAMDQWQDLERLGFITKSVHQKEAAPDHVNVPWRNVTDTSPLQPALTPTSPPTAAVTNGAGKTVALPATENGGSVQALVRTLGDKKEILVRRWKAAEALGKLGDVRGVEPLIAVLKDRDPELRWRAALALGMLKDERAVDALGEALRDDDQRIVRVRIAEALGKFRSPVATRALIHSLGDVHPDVRSMAVLSLGEIGSDTAMNAILTGLLDTDEIVRETVTNTLMKLGTVAGRALLKGLRNRNPDVKKGALTVLTRMKPEVSSGILISELENRDGEVRQMVARALDTIDWQPETPDQRALYLFAQQDWKALAKTGRAAMGVLVQGTTDADPLIRKASTALLASVGDRQAIPALTETLHDENREVRVSSVKTLLKMRGGESSRLISTLKKGGKA
jgi:HEAT repeat protein